MNLDDIIKQSIDDKLIGIASTINAYKLLLYASGLPIDDKNTVKISVKEYAKLLNITTTTNVYKLLDKAVVQLMGVHINTTYKNKKLYFNLIRKGEIGQGYLHLIYEDEFVEYLKLSSISKIKQENKNELYKSDSRL